jgi:starvation-inducible outer membrane lipoprotein
MRWLLIATMLLSLTGCVAGPRYTDNSPSSSFSESYTIRKGGKCELRCVRYGSQTTCTEYRC